MKIKKIPYVVLAWFVLTPMWASAAVINIADSQLNGNTVNDFSTDGLIDFDFLIDVEGQVTLSIELSAADQAAGFVRLRFAGAGNLAGGVERLEITSARTFGTVGDAFDSHGNAIGVTIIHDSFVRLSFAQPEMSVFTVGALGIGAVDWILEFPTTARSVKLGLRVRAGPAVPLPAGVWLFVSALAGLGVFRRRLS